MTWLKEHPQRRALASEAHARPFETVNAPERVTHLAFLSGEHAHRAERAVLLELCGQFKVEPPPIGAIHSMLDFGPFRMRYERHTEFSTYTFFAAGPFEHPFDRPAVDEAPRDIIDHLPGDMLVAVHLAVSRGDPATNNDLPDMDLAARHFELNSLVGIRAAGGAAKVYTDHQIHHDGFGRMMVVDHDLTARQAGRLVQRLLEVETYRTLALLGLPLARELAPKLSRADRTLAEIVGQMAETEETPEDRKLLERLTQLAAEIERMATSANYRFGATNAYYAIVLRRIAEIREQRLKGLQTMAEFIDRRIAPAMANCKSVDGRLESLSVRVSRSSQLLRTRVDIVLEDQNRSLLASMDRRAQLQLRLQQTVEGLSVAAISYYGASLVGYAAKALKAGGVPVDPSIVTGLSIPVLAVLVWLGVRKARKVLQEETKAPIAGSRDGGVEPPER